jgi:hypothetical protein
MADRYPGYDVLSKRDGPSWNTATRRVIEARLCLGSGEPQFLERHRLEVLEAICDRIVPQDSRRPRVPVGALIDHQLACNRDEGFRGAELPPLREAWQQILDLLDAVARKASKSGFAHATKATQIKLLSDMQAGQLSGRGIDAGYAAKLFKHYLLRDVVQAYYSHPTAWSEIGFGGPASPRGYVRMGADRRDPWEAAESHDASDREAALRANLRVR